MTNPQSATAANPFRFQIITRKALKRLAILFIALSLALVVAGFIMIRMPGRSFSGPLPALTESQQQIASETKRHVETLASEIGYRSTFHARHLAAAASYIKSELRSLGYDVRDHSFPERGSPAPNLEATLKGTVLPMEFVVVGAHFDSFQGTPGADDNASGVAATLSLARLFASHPQPRSIRFVFFPNEEPPAFQQPDMGSLVYAKKCFSDGDNITAMLSLESLGYYSDQPGSQKYPFPIGLLYPSTGNFVGFASNLSSRALLHSSIKTFRAHAKFPSQGAALPEGIPGVGWSDHWAFWQVGYPAIMITDTAIFRNPNYHKATDTPNTLDYNRLARVTEGIEAIIRDLASAR